MNDLKAIQARSLEMAEYFVAFCKKHDLLCYLCGGGAIGALRNKGSSSIYKKEYMEENFIKLPKETEEAH